MHIDGRLDAIVLRALENTPELRYQTIGEMRTQVITVVNKLGPTCYISTPEQLATFDGQMFLFRRKARMLLDDRYLSFAGAATTTVIPLAAIRDLSIGHYPRVMHPLGMDWLCLIPQFPARRPA
jgi:hypothetical protein